MRHAVLLGDSIFDNLSYVPGKPAVIEQLRYHNFSEAPYTVDELESYLEPHFLTDGPSQPY